MIESIRLERDAEKPEPFIIPVATATTWTFPAGHADKDRAHREQIELSYALDGRAHVLVEDRDCVVAAGHFFVVPNSARHRLRLDRDAGCRFTSVYIDVRSDDPGATFVERLLAELFSEPVGKIPVKQVSIVENLARIERCGERSDAISLWEKSVNLQAILIAVYRAFRGFATESPERETASAVIARRVRDEIESSYMDTLSLSEIARRVSVTPNYCASVFKKQTGIPVMEYRRRLRVRLAATRLSATDDTLARIAADTGFADAFQLSKTFKRYVGVSPREYRRSGFHGNIRLLEP